MTFADKLKNIMRGQRPLPERDNPKNNDKLMERPPMPDGVDKNIVTPEQLGRNQGIAADKRNIYDDSGKIVDYDMGALNGSKNPFDKALKDQMLDIGSSLGKKISNSYDKSGPGSIFGFVKSFMDKTPERNQPNEVNVGSATSADLNPDPFKMQPQFPPTATPQQKDYTNSLMDPKSINELRASLYEQSGQGAVPQASQASVEGTSPDPNSLAGRMSGPNSQVDMKAQQSETDSISNQFRPIGNSPIQRPGKQPDTPFSGLKSYLNQGTENEG